MSVRAGTISLDPPGAEGPTIVVPSDRHPINVSDPIQPAPVEQGRAPAPGTLAEAAERRTSARRGQETP